MKISNKSQLALQTIHSKAVGKQRIIFVSGTFNILHPGHFRLLRFAAECGDFLVVGVLADSLAPIAHLHEDIRLDGVSAINWVGHVVLEDIRQTLLKLQPAVVVVGKEHENTINQKKVLSRFNGQLLADMGILYFLRWGFCTLKQNYLIPPQS